MVCTADSVCARRHAGAYRLRLFISHWPVKSFSKEIVAGVIEEHEGNFTL